MVQDKVVFISGSASGIGYQMARSIMEEGAKVVLSDINGDKLKQAVQEARAAGGECSSVVCDVSNEDEVVYALNYVKNTYGRIDVLINNAGIQHVASIEDFPTDTYEKMLQIMLAGAFKTIKHALPDMKHQKWGRIINMSSINGLIGFSGKAAYNSAKHGLIGLTKVAALECAEHGITVNALCPGYVDTPLVRGQFEDLAKNRGVNVEDVLEEVLYPLVPQKRLLDVQEIADYALFLASDKAKGVTGQSVVLDGGYTTQ
ncbi:3-hydroxybutyrate dehydrogenase [Lentibacillus sp. JNUCC-1]|uniref:3-hydroxybutyrate dehydrogenase n=1 Tax=Lentibacillus sp. JNUCC-1 TaxID=2654513 RepID=UPI0012E7E42C|nr:3-hydroxybutyrate dehydrogenase [Lentibacillus sp. JNUCC-1]MUV37601.1 3-hydroxybutyrate dehydrogenase [Lentibacillus sp. JNUCC-1]